MMAWYIVLHSLPSDTGSSDCLRDAHAKYTLYVGGSHCHDSRQNYNGVQNPFSSQPCFNHVHS